MPSIYPVYFNVNTIIRGLVSTLGGSTLLATITQRRGDVLPCELYFGNTSTTDYRESLTTYGTISLTAKNNLDWDGTTVISVTNWTSATVNRSIGTTNGVYTYYKADLNLGGTTLNNLFTPANTASVTLQCEIEWQDRVDGTTYQVNSQPFKIVVQNDVTG